MSLLSFLFLCVLVYSVSNSSNAATSVNFFRADYQYIKETNAYYKFNTVGATWAEAKRMCESEGAKIFYPKNEAETIAVISLWKKTHNDFGAFFVGINCLVVKGIFTTFDGIPITNVYNNWRAGEPNNVDGEEDCVVLVKDGEYNDDKCSKTIPYICKKDRIEMVWNQQCQIFYKGYTYNKDEGKCYKFHKTAMNWTDAYATCYGEQSYLAVINSERERDNLISLMRLSTDQVTKVLPKGILHVGFHNRFNEGWQTLEGKSLENSGFARWDFNQPDGFTLGEKCGSMSYAGRLHDVGCNIKTSFICEHNID